MSHLTKNKIVVYLAAIFLVGGVTGELDNLGVGKSGHLGSMYSQRWAGA